MRRLVALNFTADMDPLIDLDLGAAQRRRGRLRQVAASLRRTSDGIADLDIIDQTGSEEKSYISHVGDGDYD
jgi:hypothetical protein